MGEEVKRCYCDGCPYEAECSAANGGPRRDDGDDYRALARTHFCRKDWDQFTEDMEKMHKGGKLGKS